MGPMLSDVFQDVRFGLRLLRRSPVFTAVAVSSLALGIGGAAAVFSLLNAIVLRSLPVAEPDRLFVAERHSPDDMSPRFSWLETGRLREELAGKAEIAAASSMSAVQLRPGGASAAAAAERGSIQLVSGEYFGVLGQRPQAGRLLTADDNRALDGHPVVVVSHGYWKRSLASAPDAIGQTLAINGAPFTIVGITAPAFFGTTVSMRGSRRLGAADDAVDRSLRRQRQLHRRSGYEQAVAAAGERRVAEPLRAPAQRHRAIGNRSGAHRSSSRRHRVAPRWRCRHRRPAPRRTYRSGAGRPRPVLASRPGLDGVVRPPRDDGRAAPDCERQRRQPAGGAGDIA